MPNGPLLFDLELLQLNPPNIEQREAFIDLQPDDITRIAQIKSLVAGGAERYDATFFDHRAAIQEAASLRGNRSLLAPSRMSRLWRCNSASPWVASRPPSISRKGWSC